ncbi:MAG: IclR family transcriptional regulator [Clostridia bacterium]|nr:IclR family transcriptional regulator [Clostridia bacterium]
MLNLLRTLEESGYVYRARQSHNYRLGYKIMELGYSMHSALQVVQFAIPIMEDLQLATGEFIYLTTHVNGRVLYLECVYPRRRTVGYSVSGKTLPMHCTGVGKAMMSLFTVEQVDKVIEKWGLEAKTANTITDRDALLSHLQNVRQQGYAVDLEEETPGVKCVAMPIRSANGEAAGAISISGCVRSLTDDRLGQYTKLLNDATSILSTYAYLFPAMQIMN